MVPQLIRVGAGEHPIVIVDELPFAVAEIVALATALAPFPAEAQSYYPGVRRAIGPGDRDAYRYVETLLETIAPFIGGGFDVDRFDLVGASFSMVTTPPDKLRPVQRAPHFNSVDPGYLAVLQYLCPACDTGTAFYRHRATGIERIDAANVDRFVAYARRESAALSGYTSGANAYFEQIGVVEAVPGRLVIYRGSMLHSGLIPDPGALSDDPATGRLTANIFVQAHDDRRESDRLVRTIGGDHGN